MASRTVPKTVWALGIVSLLMDISSEMIQTLVPLYLTLSIGASALVLGLIEGVAVVIAMVMRLVAGIWTDRVGSRKWMAVAGYGLSALSRPIYPLADTALAIAGARFLDRVGKGVRAAPRDALIADVTPRAQHGQAFGLRKSLDTVGGFLGPLIAIALMAATSENLQLVFWLAGIPAALAVVVLIFGVADVPRPAGSTSAATHPAPPDGKLAAWRQSLRQFDKAFWWVIGVVFVLSVARFSEAFLLLKAYETGIALTWVPLVLVGMHAVYGLAAYPAGVWSDRLGRRGMLLASLVFLVVADLVLALSAGPFAFTLGVVLWGLHMGFSQGILGALVADTAPPALRGTAFGLMNVSIGLAVLLGNLMAGVLWDVIGPASTFTAGAAFAGAALLVLVMGWRSDPQHAESRTG